MSLVKSYHLRCDSLDLSTRRGEPASVRWDRFQGCAVVSKVQIPIEVSAARARSEAKRIGWVRHREAFVLLPNHPSAGTTEITFDLCPHCAKDMVSPDA